MDALGGCRIEESGQLGLVGIYYRWQHVSVWLDSKLSG